MYGAKAVCLQGQICSAVGYYVHFYVVVTMVVLPSILWQRYATSASTKKNMTNKSLAYMYESVFLLDESVCNSGLIRCANLTDS